MTAPAPWLREGLGAGTKGDIPPVSASDVNEVFKNAQSPQVAQFASYLHELIMARTSGDGLRRAAGVGKTKLPDYLNGTHVPHLRVLKRWIIQPLSSYKPSLSDEEMATLLALHHAAAAVQPPKEPSLADQITFANEDLEQAKAKIVALSARLDAAISKNLAGDAQLERMRLIQEDLRGQLDVLIAEAETLRRGLERSRAEYQAVLKGANRRFVEFDEEQRRRIAEYQERITRLERAVAGHLENEVELRRYAARLEKTVQALTQKIKEERSLFTRLVVHAASGETLLSMEREMRRERRTAETKIKKLSNNNERLVESLQEMTKAHREDRERMHERMQQMQSEKEQLELQLAVLQAASRSPSQETYQRTHLREAG